MSTMDNIIKKRVFVGGLFQGITDGDLRERFQRFGTVTSVEIKNKRNLEGYVDKTFAYLDLELSADSYKKCLATYNNTKWKGGIVTIQPAKENFLTRLREERKVLHQEQQTDIPKETTIDEHPYHPRVEKRLENFHKAGVKDYHVDKAVPGTPIDGERNWVVGKYGRVVPIVYIRRRDKKKVMKVDPSKYVHHLKVMKDPDSKMVEDAAENDFPVTGLTWNVPEVSSDDYKKRKGDFPIEKHSSKRTSRSLDSSTFGNDFSPKESQIDSEMFKRKYLQNNLQDLRTPIPTHKNEQEVSNKTHKIVNEMDKKENAQEDFEVVDVEDVKAAVASYSYYLTNLKRKRLKQDILDSNDKKGSGFAFKEGYDSGEESCDTADTDEICSAKKQVASKERTQGRSQLTKSGDVDSPRNQESDSDDTGEIISMAKSSQKNSQDCSTTVNPKPISFGSKSPDISFNSRNFLDEHSTDSSDESPKKLDKTHVPPRGQERSVPEDADDASSLENATSFAKDRAAPRVRQFDGSALMPKITKENLASLMGETSSDESSESSESSSSESSSEVSDAGKGMEKEDGYDSDSEPDSNSSYNDKDAAASDESSESSEESSGESDSEISGSRKGMEKEDGYDSDLESNCNSSDDDKDDASRFASSGKSNDDDFKENCKIINQILSEETESSFWSERVGELSKDKSSSSQSNEKEKQVTKKPEATCNLKDERTISNMNSPFSPEKKVTLKDKNSITGKKTLSNEARLESLKQKQNEISKQKALIHGALTSLDSKDTTSPGKHFRFESEESDSESEHGIVEQAENEKNTLSKKKGLQLFDSDDEEQGDKDEGGSDAKMATDVFQFEKPQFEGKAGSKLMKLQSRFGGDKRFKLDTRFLEDKDSDSDVNDTEGNEGEADKEDEDLQEERKRSLAILEKIVGTHAMSKNRILKDSRNTFKDLSAIHYDPSKEEHSKFEQKEPESTLHDRNDSDDNIIRTQREELPPPEVTKDKFYEVSKSLKDAFGSSGGEDKSEKTPFTFFSQEEEKEEDEPTVNKATDDSATPLSSLDLMWTPKKFAYDSSDSEQENDKEETLTVLKKRIADEENNGTERQIPRKFFFQEDDVRLKEGPLWFFNVPNAAHREEKMKEKKEELKAGFRKRHRRAVRTWNRKKMEKQQRKPKR